MPRIITAAVELHICTEKSVDDPSGLWKGTCAGICIRGVPCAEFPVKNGERGEFLFLILHRFSSKSRSRSPVIKDISSHVS